MQRPRQVAPGWVVAMGRLSRYIMNDYGGGPRVLKLAWIINFQKLTTIPMLVLLMHHYGNASVAAWIYLALQGSYALVWLVKDLAFPDAKFHQPATIGAGIASLITVLGWYWLLGWLMIARGRRTGYPFADDAWFSLCIGLCIVGCTIMIAADAQKYFTLRVRTRPDHRRDVPFRATPQLSRRDGRLHQLRAHDLALAGRRRACLDLGRFLRRQYDADGGQPVTLPGVGRGTSAAHGGWFHRCFRAITR